MRGAEEANQGQQTHKEQTLTLTLIQANERKGKENIKQLKLELGRMRRDSEPVTPSGDIGGAHPSSPASQRRNSTAASNEKPDGEATEATAVGAAAPLIAAPVVAPPVTYAPVVQQSLEDANERLAGQLTEALRDLEIKEATIQALTQCYHLTL